PGHHAWSLMTQPDTWCDARSPHVTGCHGSLAKCPIASERGCQLLEPMLEICLTTPIWHLSCTLWLARCQSVAFSAQYLTKGNPMTWSRSYLTQQQSVWRHCVVVALGGAFVCLAALTVAAGAAASAPAAIQG